MMTISTLINRTNQHAVLFHVLSKHLDSNWMHLTCCLFADFINTNTITPTTLVNQLAKTHLHNNLVYQVYRFMMNRNHKVITRSSRTALQPEQIFCWQPTGLCVEPTADQYSSSGNVSTCATSGNYHLIKYADDNISTMTTYQHLT